MERLVQSGSPFGIRWQLRSCLDQDLHHLAICERRRQTQKTTGKMCQDRGSRRRRPRRAALTCSRDMRRMRHNRQPDAELPFQGARTHPPPGFVSRHHPVVRRASQTLDSAPTCFRYSRLGELPSPCANLVSPVIMNTPNSMALGWGSLLFAGGIAYYYAKKDINDRRDKEHKKRLSHTSGVASPSIAHDSWESD